MSILLQNIRTLTQNHVYVFFLKSKYNKRQIIAHTETWLSQYMEFGIFKLPCYFRKSK